jgi:HD-GYP domain-containing protein (c-di-GMP phosphodiesterase class II)
LRWRQSRQRLAQARKALEVLARVMDLSDPATSEHSRDIAKLVPRVGRMLGIRGAQCEELELAARFHDIGKVAVPEAVLRKPGPLDSDEWELMACHVEWGSELLRHLPECESIAQIVRHHHERFDGSGYPDGLSGEQIPLASRIITVCDAYGAMVSDRPYRRALSHEHALAELRDGAGEQFDPDAVAAVLSVADGSASGAPIPG